MTNVQALKQHNAARWASMHIDNDHHQLFKRVATRLIAPVAQGRYKSVEEKTKVPWYIIAVIHEREASQSWLANLAQGDPWDAVSRHIPRGQGPFKSWEAAAINALERCPPYASNWTDWTPGGALTLLEEYNGLGYANRGVPSPYLFAGTSIYISGKYISDGHYDPHAVDHQLGCAGLIKAMEELDSSIRLGGAPDPYIGG